MEEEEYEQEFEEEDPEEHHGEAKAKGSVLAPRGKPLSERRMSGHPIIRVLHDLSREKDRNRWPSQSSKQVAAVHDDSQA